MIFFAKYKHTLNKQILDSSGQCLVRGAGAGAGRGGGAEAKAAQAEGRAQEALG